MAIVDRGKSKNLLVLRLRAAGQLMMAGLLLCLVFFLPASGQPKARSNTIDRARLELDDGNYAKAIELAQTVANNQDPMQQVSALDTILVAQIAQQKYVEATKTLEDYSKIVSSSSDPRLKARVSLRASDLYRSQRKFSEALLQAKDALKTASNDREIIAGYYLSLGRILFTSGYDLSAIIWLEKAENLFELSPVSSGQIDTYRFLSLAWSSKLNYVAALKYSEKLMSAAAGSRFKHRYRQSIFESATLLASIGQGRKAMAMREKGLNLSLESRNTYQARNFLASLLLNSLYDGELSKASSYLDRLKSLDTDGEFSFETTLGKAIISGLTGQHEMSDKAFSELEERTNNSPFILPSWKKTIAEKNKEWARVIHHNHTLLNLAMARKFRDDLPGIYLSLAFAYFHLGQTVRTLEFLDKTISLVETIRSTDNNNFSLGLLEIYHRAYRLMAQTKLERPRESFELADYLKARLLQDRINNSLARATSVITPNMRLRLEMLTSDLTGLPGEDSEIGRLETLFTAHIPETVIQKPDFSVLDKIPELENKAIISYLFTADERLVAFVWEKGKPIRSVSLPEFDRDIAAEVKQTEQKIKNRIFFKRDGKELFNRLLRPLNISAPHLIIVPDKQLWKIPFHALSPDGVKYLIESKLVSYAPSVSILIEQLMTPKASRRSLHALANATYKERTLRYVNDEATSVSRMFNSEPVLNSTITDFRRLADKSDILHFSMHAQIDGDQPLDSFLGFRSVGQDNGRLTVEDILDSRLKKGSLVFLASCDTNNVLSGEGLVSLAWGMIGAGATTVISTQWEANDKSTQKFSELFYRELLKGSSTAASLQSAAIELINDKSSGFHEPYFWGGFTLLGDFR
ncbi:MAG TPA: CHAT domain-containing protein [Pyrinomonadaceae bacterium]|nr:CHAT domain-containing protein [Pyrinomonadaceae bacterium]